MYNLRTNLLVGKLIHVSEGENSKLKAIQSLVENVCKLGLKWKWCACSHEMYAPEMNIHDCFEPIERA